MMRILLQELAHHHRNPCLHNALSNMTSDVAAQNVSAACHRALEHIHGNIHEGSPIPYLLAGLAAMLALVAISLFILACSYWKLVGCVEQQAARAYAHSTGTNGISLSHPTQNNSSGSSARGDAAFLAPHELLENSNKLVVIMAGHDKPTFLAQPVGVVGSNSCTVATSNFKV